MPIRRKTGTDTSSRKQRAKVENEILEDNKAKFPFKTDTRFAKRCVAKSDGMIRESGFVADRVYWIVEAWDERND